MKHDTMKHVAANSAAATAADDPLRDPALYSNREL